MKKTIKILALFLALVTTVSVLCACGAKSGGSTKTESEVDIVRRKVQAKGWTESFGVTIGGNEIKDSSVTITNTEKISSDKYIVNGKITMIDVYGTRWNNTFDCEVTKSQYSSDWSAGKFEYRSTSWSKS